MALEIQELRRDAIDPDPRNPRQIFDEAQLVELANDIAVRGLDTPISVRKHPTAKGRFMIIFGERRWRACGLIDLQVMPCIVREMNELDVLEAQIAENNKRADVHPLEEADAYRRLHEEHGRDIDELCELQGKTRAYIYAAMKLCSLTAEPRKAFLAGKLDKSRALLIARLPPSQQKQATAEIVDRDDDGPVSYRDAAHHIRRNYMLRLVDAPFSTSNVSLVAKAGSCTACEKRSGNQRELFEDVIAAGREGGADVCTDSICYRAKVDAHWARAKVEAAAKGRQVLEGKEADGAGGYGSGKYIDLDRPAYDIGDGNKTYRQILGKHAEPVAIARDREDEIKELISRSDLPALLRDAGVKVKKESNGHASTSIAQSEYEERNRLERIVTAMTTEAILARVNDVDGLPLWRLLARMVTRVCRNDAWRAALKAHDVVAVRDYSNKYTVLKLVETFDTVDKLCAFVIELLLAEARGWLDEAARGINRDEDAEEREEGRTNLEDAAALLDIDIAAIVKKARADHAEVRDKRAKKKPAPAAETAL